MVAVTVVNVADAVESIVVSRGSAPLDGADIVSTDEVVESCCSGRPTVVADGGSATTVLNTGPLDDSTTAVVSGGITSSSVVDEAEHETAQITENTTATARRRACAPPPSASRIGIIDRSLGSSRLRRRRSRTQSTTMYRRASSLRAHRERGQTQGPPEVRFRRAVRGSPRRRTHLLNRSGRRPVHRDEDQPRQGLLTQTTLSPTQHVGRMTRHGDRSTQRRSAGRRHGRLVLRRTRQTALRKARRHDPSAPPSHGPPHAHHQPPATRTVES